MEGASVVDVLGEEREGQYNVASSDEQSAGKAARTAASGG